MKKREIFIVTGWGGHLGTGHLQRMANLARYINGHTSHRASIVCGKKPVFLPESLDDIITDAIKPGCSFIIRDKRDSTIEEMEGLKSLGRVITIDDCGPGRDLADLPIDLLPNLIYSIYSSDSFIYGLTFTDSIMMLGNCSIKKDLDFAIYYGITPPGGSIDFILSLIPENSSCAILSGDNSSLLRGGITGPLKKSYAETLLSAKILITHFGITLFEGYVSGCKLMTINPTDYHSRLSVVAADGLDLINLGVIDAVNPDQARSALYEYLSRTPSRSANPSDIYTAIREGLDMFMSRIQSFL